MEKPKRREETTSSVLTCSIDLFNQRVIEEDCEDEGMDVGETDELSHVEMEVKTVRHLNMKPRIFNSDDVNKPKKQAKGRLNFGSS